MSVNHSNFYQSTRFDCVLSSAGVTRDHLRSPEITCDYSGQRSPSYPSYLTVRRKQRAADLKNRRNSSEGLQVSMRTTTLRCEKASEQIRTRWLKNRLPGSVNSCSIRLLSGPFSRIAHSERGNWNYEIPPWCFCVMERLLFPFIIH